jgi:antirestriction protein ArdC
MATVYEVITMRILAKLEQGIVPWQQPWTGGEPKNLLSGKPYRGVNVFLLTSARYESPYWLTYRQAQTLGAHVRRGEQGYPVVFWKWREQEEDNEEKEQPSRHYAPLLRYYTVFNLAQVEGLDSVKALAKREKVLTPIAACEQVIADMPHRPAITHQEPRAYYRPLTDTINMPARGLFRSPEEYYSTLFHELTHATGHASRLARPTLMDLCPFGSTNYSKEELVAEMGAAFLCGYCGIENKTVDNSAAYIRSWLTKLRNEKTLVILAAAQAQKAADYILGKASNGEKDTLDKEVYQW